MSSMLLIESMDILNNLNKKLTFLSEAMTAVQYYMSILIFLNTARPCFSILLGDSRFIGWNLSLCCHLAIMVWYNKVQNWG